MPGLNLETLCGPDYARTQAFAWQIRQVAEAFLIPGCTALPEGNLLIFPDKLRADSRLQVMEHVAPQLRAI